MAVTSNDIANQAIQLIGNNQAPVTGQSPTFDNSTAGVALQYLYPACVNTVARQFEWDFARNLVSLTLSGNVAPVGWTYEYLYPTNGVEVWQLQPATITDAYNPLPVNWAVGNTLVTGVQTKVIWADLVNARAVYNNAPTENTWDAGFREAVVRLLASELAMAIAGKPETSKLMLDTAMQFTNLARGRED